MASNIYNPNTGQTGYQVPGASLQPGWVWGTPSTPTTSNNSISPGGLPATDLMAELRAQIQSGQLTPDQAYSSYVSRTGLGGNAYQLQQMGGPSAIKQTLFSGLGQVTQGGRTGVLDSSGAFTATSAQLKQSNTSANTGSTNTSVSNVGAPSYTVKSGDTLSQIATKNGLTLQQLLTYNPQYQTNPNLIRPGENINLGAGSGTYTPSVPTTTTATAGGEGGAIGAGLQSTGNPSLDAAMSSILGLANDVVSKGYTIPTTLQITPDLISTFLSWAHQNVDPQTQQLLNAEGANINASLKNFQVQHDVNQGELAQKFSTDLATEQNTAGANGVAFGGQRNLNEQNLESSTNRNLALNDANSALNIGNALRTGAANVGSSNTSMFNLPSIAGGRVSTSGGQRGSFNNGPSLDFGYNPSLYTAGNIPTAQNTALNNLQGNYLSTYGILASNNSNGSRSVSDLLGMIPNRPANPSTNF